MASADLYDVKQQMPGINTNIPTSRALTEQLSQHSNRDSSTFYLLGNQHTKALQWCSIFLASIGMLFIIYSALWIIQNKGDKCFNSYSDDGITISYHCTINRTPTISLLLVGACMILQGASGIRASIGNSYRLASVHKRKFNSLLFIIVLILSIRSYSLTKNMVVEGREVSDMVNALPFLSPRGTNNSTHIHFINEALEMPNNYTLLINGSSTINLVLNESENVAMIVSLDPMEIEVEESAVVSINLGVSELHVVIDIMKLASLVSNNLLMECIVELILCVLACLVLYRISLSINDNYLSSVFPDPISDDNQATNIKEKDPFAFQK
jgi:hypothetical protein